MKKYRKRAEAFVTAVQLDLDTEGFEYRKWGGTQVCKPGDWLINNDGDVYTVDRETFARTYRERSPGVYCKSTVVLARRSDRAGTIDTKEGATHFDAGDYIVYNDDASTDGYAVEKRKFDAMYEPLDDEPGL